jgi:hypothetical protein
MSLQGVLRDFGVSDVFQLIGQQRKTGILTVESRELEIRVFFREGQVVRARPHEERADATLAEFLLRTGAISESALSDGWRLQHETLEALPSVLTEHRLVAKQDLERAAKLVTDEALFELFGWQQGRFAFTPESFEQEVGDRMAGAEMVLLDQLRMRDEWPSVERSLPDLGVVLMRTCDVEDFRRQRDEVERASGVPGEQLERLFLLVNGRLSARRAIDLSHLGTFQGARGLAALVERGLLDSVAPVERRPSRPREQTDRPGPALAPLWLALAAGSAAALLAAPAPREASFPLAPAPLVEMRSSAEIERLRSALEAHRWAHGAYPDRLTELGSGPLLAGVRLDRYVFARTPLGYSLVPALLVPADRVARTGAG